MVGTVKIHKMTEWDAGQLLIARSDDLWEAAVELRKGGFKEAANAVNKAATLIGDVFNKNHQGKSHTFGLNGSGAGPEPESKKD